jgi:hypothetical protein
MSGYSPKFEAHSGRTASVFKIPSFITHLDQLMAEVASKAAS